MNRSLYMFYKLDFYRSNHMRKIMPKILEINKRFYHLSRMQENQLPKSFLICMHKCLVSNYNTKMVDHFQNNIKYKDNIILKNIPSNKLKLLIFPQAVCQ